ncbi:MAG TPA: S8 family serine peptidase [Blastocatellia bacterium]|jgi:serine protease AprX|nr:S8 family serine peptidase [Blastocatellia bacterium]
MNRVTSPGIRLTFSLLLISICAINTLGGVSFVSGQGLFLTNSNAVVLTGADAVVLTGADAVVLTGADAVVLTGADAVVLTGADGAPLTETDGFVFTGSDSLTYTRPYAVVLTGADSDQPRGIKSVDPQLALVLNELPDSSSINVFITFHRTPSEEDLNVLRAAGIYGGTRFRNLPMVMVNATRRQIAAVSTSPAIRSIYLNKNFEFFTRDTRTLTCQASVLTDTVLTRRNGGMPVSGRGVTVAVLDTGIDATHPDLQYGTQVAENVRVADFQGSAPGFIYPSTVEGVVNSDPVMGHGTLVAGIIAGTGVASGGYYGGMAPGAKLLGVSAGDASLFYVLSGIDYILSNRAAQNVRVVNCSFGISGVFDANDPVNIATKIMHDAGISVVFSAGNRGDQPNSLNPYSVAPWVIGVGASTKGGELASFSSRGAAGYSIYHPTLVAPGENIVSSRALGVNVVATAGLASSLLSPDNDLRGIPLSYVSRYTMSSGTSFAAPHVSGTIAMMLQANPQLTPDQIKSILQETASPMLAYGRYEVGAGSLNAYAAVKKAALGTPFGQFRTALTEASLPLTHEQIVQFGGEVAPDGTYTTTFQVPRDAVFATAQVAWAQAGGILNKLQIEVERSGRTVKSKPATSIGGIGLQRTGVTVNYPSPGEWILRIKNAGDAVTGGLQRFTGALEIFRSDSARISGLNQLQPAVQDAVWRALRTGILTSQNDNFSAGSSATRLEVARALMLASGARVPQYLPYTPSFIDVGNNSNTVFIESVVHSPRGNLMGATGASFYPQARVERMMAAMALVKAAGLEQEAMNASSINPGISDWSTVPENMRGYVSVAVSRNLMGSSGAQYFRPFDSITRAELAMAAISLQQAAR